MRTGYLILRAIIVKRDAGVCSELDKFLCGLAVNRRGQLAR